MSESHISAEPSDQENSTSTKKFYTFAEALTVLDVSEKTLRNALDEGRIPFIKVGPKAIRISIKVIDEMAAVADGAEA